MAFEKGHKLSKGRPTKVEEQKTNTILLLAIKQIKNVDTDEEAKIELVKDLYETQRGQLFIAEHLLGKPKEIVETTHNINDFNIKDIFKIGDKS